MRYYEVAVEKLAVKGQRTLTYSSEEERFAGDVVRVPLGRGAANGIVTVEAKKPKYRTKPIATVLYPAAIPAQLLELADWMSDYYATELPLALQQLLPAGVHKKRRDELSAPATSGGRPASDQKLTKEQAAALKILEKTTGTALVHGVTGSGKTRLYLERAKAARTKGQGVIVLVPEIGLTAQLVADFSHTFKDVFVVHSQQTESLRHQQWQAILNHPAPVVVGPRSALFSPVKNLGLIVVDEEHEHSYKQEQSPKYHAVRVAGQLARLHGAQLLLGSATPSVEDYYLATARKAPVVRLSEPARPGHEVTSSVVDLRRKEHFGKRSRLFSAPLIEAVDEALAAGKQAMLFHNRRGTSTMVVCTSCGWVAACPNCLLPLTHHRDWGRLVCHVCNYRMDAPHACPECREPALLFKGFGTKQIEDEARKLWPTAKVARFDSDTHRDEHLSKRYDEIYRGDIDILVGTQMIAKGLDLPQLAMVGVVLADTALYLPDFSANERAFQLLYQVIGRTGRHGPGRVVIQSYSPQQPAIAAALKRDYQLFYENEIKERELAHYPPFGFLLILRVEYATRDNAIRAAQELRDKLKAKHRGLNVLGPSPAFHERTATGYRWQLVIKSPKRPTLTQIVREDLPDRWQFELDPANLL